MGSTRFKSNTGKSFTDLEKDHKKYKFEDELLKNNILEDEWYKVAGILQ